MIYPTRNAVIAAIAGAPVALLVAIALPTGWAVAMAWPVAVLLLCLIDSFSTRGRPVVALDLPDTAYVGDTREVAVAVDLSSSPRTAQLALSPSPLVSPVNDGRAALSFDKGKARAEIPLDMLRRGSVRFDRLWLRWMGRLGFVWRQQELAIDGGFAILPDLRPVHRHGITLFRRHSMDGQMRQLMRGEGSDFDSLTEYRPGMDRRTIDWKQSARSTKLLAKLYQGERNSQLHFVIDCGRAMTDPVGGLPRVDRAISAAMLTGWVALKIGDRVAIDAFDSRPRLTSGLVSGPRGFAELQQAAASIDYSSEESNFTLALAKLSARMTRRSMVVLFTEIEDPTSADFLLRALRPLLEKHHILVVVMRDDELEEIARSEPESNDDVTRAITATALLKDRAVVLGQLRHLGVDVIEAEHDRVGERLAEAYLRMKNRAMF